MSTQFTSGVGKIHDGKSESHTTPDNIQVIDAEVRWKGINRSETNYNSYAVSNDDGTQVDSTGTFTASCTIPKTNIGSFDHIFVSGGISYEPDSGNGSIKVEFPWKTVKESWSGSSGYVDFSDTKYDESYEGDTVKTTITVDNYGGSTFNIYANASHHRTTSTTTTYKTKNPEVGGDWSGSYGGYVDDGAWTSWQPLSGISEGVNNFAHKIKGSGKAKFEFRYTYKPATPTAVDIFTVKISGTAHDVALADPSDSSLEYDNVRVQSNGKTLCMDVVDPSNPDAIDAFIQTPHGKLALRENTE